MCGVKVSLGGGGNRSQRRMGQDREQPLVSCSQKTLAKLWRPLPRPLTFTGCVCPDVFGFHQCSLPIWVWKLERVVTLAKGGGQGWCLHIPFICIHSVLPHLGNTCCKASHSARHRANGFTNNLTTIIEDTWLGIGDTKLK